MGLNIKLQIRWNRCKAKQIPHHHHSPWFFFSMVQQPKVSQSLLVIEALRSHSHTHTHSHTHSHTPCSVGLRWTSDQPDLYLTKHDPQETRHPCLRRDSNPNPSKRAAEHRGLNRAATGIGRRCTHVENFEQLYCCSTGQTLQIALII